MCTNNSESATVELVHWRQQLLVVGELGLAGWDSHQWDSVPLPPTEIATSGTRSTPSSSRPPPFIPITIFQLVNRIKCENSNNQIRFFQRLKKTAMAWLPGLEFLRWDQICKISRRHYNEDNIEQDVFGQQGPGVFAPVGCDCFCSRVCLGFRLWAVTAVRQDSSNSGRFFPFCFFCSQYFMVCKKTIIKSM